MSKEKGLNFRAISIIITLLVITGTFVNGYHNLQFTSNAQGKEIERVESKLDNCVNEIKDDISDVKEDMGNVKINVGKLQTDLKTLKENTKENNTYIRGRLDYIAGELAKQNRIN